MRVSVESILLLNFTADFFFIYCAVRPIRKVQISRVFAASLLGAAAACLITILEIPNPAKTLMAIVLIIILPAICCGFSEIRSICASGTYLLTGGAIAAAILPLLLPQLPFAASFAVAGAVSYIVNSRKRRIAQTWEVQAEVFFNGQRAAFDGIVDTGNRLTEPLSSLPVLIVCAGKIQHLLPHDFNPGDPYHTLPEGFRLVGYGGVGGTGEMACFMPDDLRILSGGKCFHRKNALWVAVYPGNLPGKTCALIPYPAIQ